MKLQLLVIHTVCQHIVDMLQFVLAVTFKVKDTVINDPEFVKKQVDIDTGDNTDSFDHTMSITTVLPSDQFDLEREIFLILTDSVVSSVTLPLTQKLINYEANYRYKKSHLIYVQEIYILPKFCSVGVSNRLTQQ